MVPTFDPSIIANADTTVKIPVQTKERTNTDTALLLCKINVERIQTIKDFRLFEVNCFTIFLKPPFANHAIVSSQKRIPKRNNHNPQRNSIIQFNMPILEDKIS